MILIEYHTSMTSPLVVNSLYSMKPGIGKMLHSDKHQPITTPHQGYTYLSYVGRVKRTKVKIKIHCSNNNNIKVACFLWRDVRVWLAHQETERTDETPANLPPTIRFRAEHHLQVVIHAVVT